MARVKVFVAKKIGDWNGAINYLAQMSYRVKTVTKREQLQVVKDLKRIVIGHIINQDLNWQPLSEHTKSRKNQENKDKILIDTELYLNSITITRDNDSVSVGIAKGKAYRKKGNFTSVDRVANMLEYGTTRMPARPLWNPSLDEMGGAKGIKNRIAKAIYDKLASSARNTPMRVTKNQIIKSAR